MPGAENEPFLAGDATITWDEGGSNCEGDEITGSPDCFARHRIKPESKAARIKPESGAARFNVGDIIDDLPDRIVVIGRRLLHPAAVIRRFSGIVGAFPAQGTVREVNALPDNPEESDPPQDCTAATIGDMGGLLSPQQQQAVSDFLNSQAGQELWNDSGYVPFIFVGRLEQGGYLFPDGTFLRGQNSVSGPCNVEFDPPPQPVPDGTILVHTQPFSHPDPLTICNSTLFYQNLPGEPRDVEALVGTGLSTGLIIDADGIIVFSSSYDSVYSPDQAQSKRDEDGNCGVNRNE